MIYMYENNFLSKYTVHKMLHNSLIDPSNPRNNFSFYPRSKKSGLEVERYKGNQLNAVNGKFSYLDHYKISYLHHEKRISNDSCPKLSDSSKKKYLVEDKL